MRNKQIDQPEEGKRASSTKGEKQPYRMRLPGFIVDEEIGLGDAIQRVTYAMGIRPSSGCGCERRAAVLNRRIVFSPRQSD